MLKMQSLSAKARGFLAKTVDLVLPPRCVMTGEIVATQGMSSPKAWAKLDFITDPMCRVCGVPFGYEVEKDTVCAVCLADPPHYARARAPLKYDEASRDLILGFKHGDQTHFARSFMPWLISAGAEILAEADYLVPVPLHRLRLLKRRYNQAALLAHALAAARPGVTVLVEALKRVRPTPSQGSMAADARRKNVRKAFEVHPAEKQKIHGKNILLIDDVMTTGATVDECARVLMAAGAARVDVLVVARRVKEGFF